VLSCRRAKRALEARSDDRLGLERGFELQEHLSLCEGCRSHARSLERLDEALDGLADPPLQRLDMEASVQSIRAELEARSAKAALSVHSGRPSRRLIAAVVAAILIALFSVLASRPRDAQGTPQLASKIGPGEELARGDARLITPTPPAPDPEPIDDERQRTVRAEIARLLAEASSGITDDSPAEQVEAFAQLFDLNSLPLRRADWPVLRTVERLLETPDLATACAAARYLGLRGDVISRSRLELALARPEVARAATLAFRDAGANGVVGLGVALEVESVRELAVEALNHTGGPEAARALATAIKATDPMLDRIGRARLLESLASLGTDALDPLFRLSLDGEFDLEQLIVHFAPIEGAGDWLLASMDRRERAWPRELRLRAAAVLAPKRAADFLEEHLHSRDRDLEELARELLPRIPGPVTVASLIHLSDDPRLASEDLQGMTRSALAFDELRFAEAGSKLLDNAHISGATVLAELLIAAESAMALPAVRVLHDSPELPITLTRDLVALIGAHGDTGDVDPLLTLFARLGVEDRLFAASCILALHQLGGDVAVERALSGARERTLMNTLGLLRRRTAGSGTNPSLYKLARELRPHLSTRTLNSWRSSS